MGAQLWPTDPLTRRASGADGRGCLRHHRHQARSSGAATARGPDGGDPRSFDIVIWTTDGDGEVNDELEWWRATGQRGRVDKWNRLYAVHPDDRQKVQDAWAEALRNRRQYSVICRVQWGDAYVPIVSRAVSVMGRNGTIDGWVGFTARQDSMAFSMGFPAEASPLTPGQVRAARGYLGWSAEQLAEQAGVSFSTVRRVETPGERGVREQSIGAIRKALERAGIAFSTGADGRTGVSLK